MGRVLGVLSSTSSTERHLSLQLLSLFSGLLSLQMKFPHLELCRFFWGVVAGVNSPSERHDCLHISTFPTGTLTHSVRSGAVSVAHHALLGEPIVMWFAIIINN